MKILLVEDDRSLAHLLKVTLEQHQHQVELAIDGQEGWELTESFPYDLILLDWMLPRLDGISFCKRLRSEAHSAIPQPNQQTPVLLITALDAVTHKIMGLDAGADDYVVKPLDLEELQARIRALERRGRAPRSTTLEWQGLRLQPKNGEVTYHDKPIALTFKEYQILELLLRHPHQIFSQGQLIEHLWGQDETPTENAVRAQVKGLRHKLKQAGIEEVIETIYKLGYRLKKRTGEPDAAAPLRPRPAAPAIASEFWEVWLDCRSSYLDRVTCIGKAVSALEAGQLVPQLQEQAVREAHTLVGSLGSFGLDEASRLSYQIQQILKQDKGLEPSDVVPLQALLQALRQAMLPESPSEFHPSPAIASKSSCTDSSCFIASFSKLLFIEDDVALATLLATEAISWGIQTTIASNLTQAKQSLLQQVPQAVLLDLTLSESGESGLDFLIELQNQYPTVPVLVFTAKDSLIDRVQAARLGCKGFFQKPIAPSQVLGRVAQTIQQSHQARSKLLIVDDDPQILLLLQHLLIPEGYELTLLDNAQQFWEVLEQTSPDLVILDIQLQSHAVPVSSSALDLNGFDLCQIIRNDLQWGKLPILFLSSATDATTIQQGFETGADDFLHKPIVPLELLTRVRKRLEQGQIRRQTEMDELTGVRNRHKSLQDLTRLLRLAQRQQQPLSLAVLDLDHFKQVNDQYGHEMGDRVLNCFGHLLQQSFREEDVVGRWGGEEFVVGLYGISKQDGAHRLMELLQRFSTQTFTARDGRIFQVTFSGGIAQFWEDGTDLQMLCRAADRALYRAKAQGKNQVLEAIEQE